MRPLSTFRARLLLTLLGFVVVAELVVAAAVLHSAYNRTLEQANTSLTVADRVLSRLMALRSSQLLSTVDILTSDFGFRSAVATEDGETLRSSLTNFGRRVGADIAVLTRPAGALMATIPMTLEDAGTQPFDEILADARTQGRGAGLVMIDNRPFQFVLVPVYAPRLIAWTGMGFEITESLARSLSSITGVNVKFSVLSDGREIYHAESGDPGVATAGAPGALNSGDRLQTDRVLLDTRDAQLCVILSLARSEVMADYYALALNLVLIFLVTLVVSAVVAIWLASKLSRPVRNLSVFAESVAAGSYTEAPQSHSIGELNVLASALNDMQTAVRQREQYIRHQAMNDALTGLPNRESIRETLFDYFHAERRFAAIRIAVHGFARINSALGYQLGDEVLKTVAQRMRHAIDPAHPLGRVEGNDFLLLYETGGNQEQVSRWVEQLRAAVQHPVPILNTPIKIALEFGVVMAPMLANDIDAVWRRSVIARDGSRADSARVFFYQPGMDDVQRRELTIIRDLSDALKRDELTLAYQPQMSLKTGAVRQVEALARWQHPALGFVPPDEFIGLAERSGQINLITEWLVSRLTRQMHDWRRNKVPLGVSLNLSGDEVGNEALPGLIAPLIDARESEYDITLEVTESALLRDPTAAMKNLAEMQASGARIAVDDFGTGYSSFSQLKQLAANELKIDKSLILKLDTTPVDQHIVRSVIDLGHQLGLEVVAEGIENAATLHYLAEHGADLIQGYYLARPMPASALSEWIRAHQSRQDKWAARQILTGRGH